jgi:hypothetical protein
VTPSPRLKHQVIVGNLYLAIASWLETHPVGCVYLSPLDVVMSPHDVVQGTPDLVVEVASSATRSIPPDPPVHPVL